MMWPMASGVKVYLATGITDLRKSINTLAIMVAEQMDLDPLSGHLFAFCNRKRDTVKALYWDRNGFCLWHKRLERDKFQWPQTTSEAACISMRQLGWLLDGLSLAQPAHETLKYAIVR
jgi:transposase